MLTSNVSFRSIFLVFCFGLFHPLMSMAAVLPAELRDMIGGYFVFEEGYRSGNWELATSEITTMNELFLRSEIRIRDQASNAQERALVRDIQTLLGELKISVLAKDAEQTHKIYVSLQRPVIQVVELFEYQQHPLVYHLLEELDERIEAIEAGEVEYHELLEETEEMEEALETFKALVGGPRNEKELAQAITLNSALEKAAKAEDSEVILKLLKDMYRLFEDLNI